MTQDSIFQESATLSQLRRYLGNLQALSISGKTQELSNYIEANVQGYFAYTEIAISVLRHTFNEAAYLYIHTDGKMSRESLIKIETSKQALAFIQGTGLEVMLEEYGLDYNADNLRQVFYRTFHVKA